jgi:gamma-glutamyl hydrolase
MFSRSVFATALLNSVLARQLKNSSPNFDLNEQPVIGIVSQGIDSDFVNDPRFVGYDSYIMAAYVKFIEAAGARVVPLVWNEPAEVTMDKLSKLDGVLFPGGANSYVQYGEKIIQKLMEYNDEGHFYPAWGTCLGYEALMVWASSAGDDILEVYNAHAISLPLSFLEKPESTKMFADLGD